MHQASGGTNVNDFKIEMKRRQMLKTGIAAGVAMAMPAVRTARAANGEIRFCNIESGPENVASLKRICAEYETQTGVHVEMETIVGTTLWEKVTAAIKSGRPYDLIDFAQPTQTILMAKQGQLTPLTGLLNEIGLDEFNPKSLLKYNSDQWCFPFIMNLCGLYYRSDWLAQRGFSVPKTWSEFSEVAKAFTDSSKRQYGTTLPYSKGTTPWGNSGFLWAAGVEFYDDQWNVLLDNAEIKPKLARALQFIMDLAPTNAPGQFSMSFQQISTNFLTNVAGIASGAGLLVESIDAKYPEFEDKFVAAPYPAPDGGKGTVVFGGKSLGVGNTPNAEKTIDFMRWLVKSDKLTEFHLDTPYYAQPALRSIYSDAKWVENARVKKHPATIKTLESYLDPNATNMDAVQLQGPYTSVNQGMIVNQETILEMYQNVLTNKMSISEAIDMTANKVRGFTQKDA